MTLKGVVVCGRQEAAGFLAVPWVAEQIRAKLGFSTFPGTLNLRLREAASLDAWRSLRAGDTPVTLASPDPAFCDAACFPVSVNGKVPGAVLLPLVPGYPEDIVEVVASEGLRARFGLAEGDECSVTVAPLPSWARGMSAVLFDFEGTLVDFQWKLAEAEAELRGVLGDLGFDLAPFAADNYAVLRTRALELAPSEDQRREIDRRFGEIYDRYDRDAGSRWSRRPGALELLAALRASGRGLALVSNIGRSTLEPVLERLGLSGALDVVLTRNDVARAKPSGEGFRKALSLLGAAADSALVVGDSLTDLRAARDAGVRVAILAGGESPSEAIAREAPDRLVSSLFEVGALLVEGFR